MNAMLRGRRGFRSLLSMIALAGAVTDASADPIPITVISGVIEFEGSAVGPENPGRFTLTGTDRFRMSADGSAIGFCTVCGPGEVNLSFGILAHSGSITHQGITRDFELTPQTPGGGELVASAGSVVLPPLGNDGERLLFQTAFSLDPNSIVGTPEQMFQLTGRGRGEATFLQEGTAWLFETARFEFQAVPEPSTVLLVGSGLAGSWLRRRLAAKP